VNQPLVRFENSYSQTFPELNEMWQAAPASAPRPLIINQQLAHDLGIDLAALDTPSGTDFLVGNLVLEGSTPVAMAYAGHQFGGYSPRLGDGRALLLGEVINVAEERRDINLKGSGRTPFSRGGDGKAVVGPMLREYIISEAMHALGIPTTRSLAVIATGDQVARETWLPGAVLCRVAESHLRVGTFQFAAQHEDETLLQRLADYAIDRHYPHARQSDNRHLAFFQAVVTQQASLLAQWMLVGFIHGVMNTDNMTISGETIDYGPCAFMDAFDPTTVFSSIDHQGRYAYANQPHIAQWNLARLAETLLPLFADSQEKSVEVATAILLDFTEQYQSFWLQGMRKKLGIMNEQNGDEGLINELLDIMHAQKVDFTSLFRSLSSSVRGDSSSARALFTEPTAFDQWEPSWHARLSLETTDGMAVADVMDLVNPIYIPRNHTVEAALTAATEGDLTALHRLLDVLAQPFKQRSGYESFAIPAPSEFAHYQTFCGT